MDYDLIVVKTLERVYKNYYYIIRGKMKAVVSITIDNEFAVHDIKIIEGEKGVFIAMPSRKNAEGEYRDVAHPINSDTRTQLQEMIMEKYREEIAEA